MGRPEGSVDSETHSAHQIRRENRRSPLPWLGQMLFQKLAMTSLRCKYGRHGITDDAHGEAGTYAAEASSDLQASWPHDC